MRGKRRTLVFWIGTAKVWADMLVELNEATSGSSSLLTAIPGIMSLDTIDADHLDKKKLDALILRHNSFKISCNRHRQGWSRARKTLV